MEESLIVTDYHAALLFTFENARAKNKLSTALLQSINSLVMRKSTGKIYNTIFGTVDARTGAFKKGNVTAGNSYFPNYDKVERLTNDLIKQLNDAMDKRLSTEEQLTLS